MSCPICRRELPAVAAGEKSFAPFCSQRCQQVDFHRWWQGKYVLTQDVDLADLPPDVEFDLLCDGEE